MTKNGELIKLAAARIIYDLEKKAISSRVTRSALQKALGRFGPHWAQKVFPEMWARGGEYKSIQKLLEKYMKNPKAVKLLGDTPVGGFASNPQIKKLINAGYQMKPEDILSLLG